MEEKKNGHYYFAYGSNMNCVQMDFRCSRAEPVDRAILYGYRFVINERGVATIVPDPGSLVLGLVWKVSETDEQMLDSYEGVGAGHYLKTAAPVVSTGSDMTYECLIYLASNDRPGIPREGYLEGIVEACRALEFPVGYISSLESLLVKEHICV